MKRYQLLQVTSPLVEMECGGTVVRSEHIKNTKDNPNFPQPVITFDVVSWEASVCVLCVCVCEFGTSQMHGYETESCLH